MIFVTATAWTATDMRSRRDEATTAVFRADGRAGPAPAASGEDASERAHRAYDDACSPRGPYVAFHFVRSRFTTGCDSGERGDPGSDRRVVVSVNVPRRGPRTRRGRRWRPCRPSRPSRRRRASRRSTSRRCCWWVEEERGGSATARGTLGHDSPASIGIGGKPCIRGIARARHARDRSTVRRARASAGPSEMRGRHAARVLHTRVCRVFHSCRSRARPARESPKPRLASVRSHRHRVVASDRFCVGFPAGNADAPLVGAHGGALRDEGVGGGEASHLLRCLSCVEGEACADMRPAHERWQ